MLKGIVKVLGLALIVVMLLIMANHVQAARGIPGSQEFGFGTVLFFNRSSSVNEAVQMAVELQPDWLYLPVSWSALFPQPGQADLDALDMVMKGLGQQPIAVAVSITSAPQWAMSEKGPDPAQTAALVKFLVQQYPGKIQAVELFPRANTRSGWGSTANPEAYAALFAQVRQTLRDEGLQVMLVAAGLQPLALTPADGDMNDLVFLQGLYDAGSKGAMPLISIQFVELTGVPLTAPYDGEYRVLRHYEQVRKVMVKNNHQAGLLWVTHLSLPNGTIQSADGQYKDPNQQMEWLKSAYIQMRSQLYIGAAFLHTLNNSEENTYAMTSMIDAGGGRHPFYGKFQEFVIRNAQVKWMEKPGRPKSGGLDKAR
jgi:hypothetical protein